MSPLVIALLVAQGILFVAWVALMFRALFGILGRYRAASGKRWIGPIKVFSVYGSYLKDRSYRHEKRLVIAVFGLFVLVSYVRFKIQTS